MNSRFQAPSGTSGRPVCLTIAGFDPSSGAGITADLKTFAALGCYGVAAITALTVQSTLGVRSVEPVSSRLLRETLACLADDVEPAAVKIGMLATADAVGETLRFLRARPRLLQRVVLDPVIRSSSGAALLEEAAVASMRRELLGVVGWITPNLDELAVLIGQAAVERNAVPAAAARLVELGAAAGNPGLSVVVTGGHLERPDDYLFSGGEGQWIEGERIETQSTHGTGCAFSSALAAMLAQGVDGVDAVRRAKQYVTAALAAAYPVGRGRGPLHHLVTLGE